MTGAYSITDLAPGSYRVQFQVNSYWDGMASVRPNLVPEYYEDTTDYMSAALVDVTVSNATGIDATLAEGRSISGKVSIPEGMDPLALGAIWVSASGFSGNGGYGSAMVDPVTGEYSLVGLAPGSYRVQFQVNSYWDGDSSVRPNLVSEYYDDAVDYMSATAVDVTAGNATTIDADLVEGRSISGTVTIPDDVDPDWIRGVSVSASGIAGLSSGSGSIDPTTGNYSITGLAPGAYRLQFGVGSYFDGASQITPNLVSEYYNDTTNWASATPIDVTAGDLDAIDAALEEGTSISGTVTLPAGASADLLQGISVSAIGPDGTSNWNSSTQVDPSTGEFTITRLPAGEHRVMFMPSGSSLLAPEYYDDATSLEEANPVSTASGDATGIDAQLGYGARMGGTIDVTALRATASPETGFGVWVTDETGLIEYTGYGDPFYADEIPLHVGVLRPGTYRIAIITSTWDEATNTSTPQSAQYLRIGDSASITVEAGEEITDLHLTARATDTTIAGTLTAQGFNLDPVDGILGSALLYERIDDDWVRLPDARFNTNQNGTTPFTLNVPSGTYTVGYEDDYSTTGIDTTEQWWNTKTTLATADPITLDSGQTTTNINGTIQPTDYAIPAHAPSAPRAVVAVAGPASAAVSWQAPLTDGGSPIAEYTVQAFPGGVVTRTTALSTVIDGLQRGTPYTFTVTARNDAGLMSSLSAPSAPIIPLPTIVFSDTNGHVFQAEIAWLAANGISRGWEVRPGVFEFRPQNQILRGEMAAFLFRLAGQPSFTPPTTSPFVDVPTSHVFYKEIAWMASMGISKGWATPHGTEFRAEWSTSREVMAAFLYRFKDSPSYTPTGDSPFRDVRPGLVFYGEILWLAAEGISTGWNAGAGCREYRPAQNVLRSEMAAFLYRMETGGTTPVNSSNCLAS